MARRRTVDASSWDGETIGLVDAILVLTRILSTRVDREARRLKKTDGDWFSEEVLAAMCDLKFDSAIEKLIYRENVEAMDIIRRAAELIGTRPSEVATPASARAELQE